jgi:pimeloyl-ACP methyl ester carboxylesterase
MNHINVSADGGSIAVEVAGEGPLVVCSPAMGDTRGAYDILSADLVTAGYRVARMDLRGHGDSSAGFTSYGDEESAGDIIAVIEELGGGRALIAGASMSAAAAAIAAARRPELVAGLVLICPFLRGGTSAAARSIMHLALARPWGPAVWRAYSTKLWPGLGDKAGERADQLTTLLTRPGRWAAFHATTATDHGVVAPWLPRVQAPVLVVIGDQDPDWPDPLAEATWVASNFAESELLSVPGAGHAPMLERPETVTPAVRRFADGLRATGVLGGTDA